jgi:hypothetical protein
MAAPRSALAGDMAPRLVVLNEWTLVWARETETEEEEEAEGAD